MATTPTTGGSREPARRAELPEQVSYAEFGEQFFRYGVTAERVLVAVNLLAGQPIAVGPVGVGPGGLVGLTARGAVGAGSITALRGPEVAFRVELPLDLAFDLDLALETHHFTADLTIPLRLAARALDGLLVAIDISPPQARDVSIDLKAKGLRASVVNRVAGVEGEVRRFVAGYVAKEIAKDYVQRALVIDVGAAVDAAWERLAPRGPSPTAAHIRDDFQDAAESELEESGARDGVAGGSAT